MINRGYDVPEVRVAVTSSNMNQIVQRIGRTLRKTAGKDTALIYTIYLSHTHDFGTLKMVKHATKVEDENNSPKVSDSNLDRYVL